MSRLAAIDIGTNSILLLVLESRDGHLHVLEDRCRIEGLGRGLDRTGRLDEAAIGRGLSALEEFAAAISAAGVTRTAIVGTQALREATNGTDFLSPATKILGTPVEVIGGRREAELAFRAVSGSFPSLAHDRIVVCDVGGGSTELTGASRGQIESLVSVPIGAVRMTERCLGADPPTNDQVAAMRAAIAKAFAAVTIPGGILVAVSGTATTLAAVELGIDPYDGGRVHGARLSIPAMRQQIAHYGSLPNEARKRIPGLHPKRADTIFAGATILEHVATAMGAPDLIVSDHGIRWGLAYEILG